MVGRKGCGADLGGGWCLGGGISGEDGRGIVGGEIGREGGWVGAFVLPLFRGVGGGGDGRQYADKRGDGNESNV